MQFVGLLLDDAGVEDFLVNVKGHLGETGYYNL